MMMTTTTTKTKTTVTTKTTSEVTFLQYSHLLPLACKNKNLKMVKLLQQHGAKFEESHFPDAVKSGSRELISNFVEQGWAEDSEVVL